MSDPLEGVLDTIDPTAAQPTPETPVAEPNTVTIDKDELARLQQTAQQITGLAPLLQELQANPGLIHDLRARAIEQAAPPQPAADPNTEFWQDPSGQTMRIAQQEAAKQTAATNAQLGQMIINNYKLSKQNSEFFHVCGPIFDTLIKNLNRGQLATSSPDQVQFILDAAWRSAVGEYTEKKLADRKKNPPTNLGTGSGAGGGGGVKAKRTLQEVDNGAYITALNAGLSEEQMQEIADQLGGEE